MIRIYFPLSRYIYFIIVISFLFADEKKSSADIQKDINSRNTELQSIRKEIKNIELQLIHTNKEAISSTERLITLENKISLTEKLIRSLNREEKYISRVLLDTEMQIENMEKKLVKLKSQLRKRLQYLYIHGRPGILETVLLSKDWNSTIYRVKYLDVLATHEKKIRLDIAGNLDQLDDEKEKRSIELNHKKALLKEKKKEGKTLNKDKKKRKKILVDLEKEKLQLKKSHSKKTHMAKEMEKLIKK